MTDSTATVASAAASGPAPFPETRAFLSQVKEHTLKILRDDGVDRHLRFREGGSIVYGFDILTWPGHLCITGDMGTYVFARLPDMFQFFRRNAREGGDPVPINPSYWAQKLLSADVQCPVRVYDKKILVQAIDDRIAREIDDIRMHGFDDEEEADRIAGIERLRVAVRRHLRLEGFDLRGDLDSVIAFTHEGRHPFQDFYEIDPRTYSSHFLWNLRAIVWGIDVYDAEKSKSEEAVVTAS